MPFHSKRKAGRAGSESSAAAWLASPSSSPRHTAPAMARAAGSRKSCALCAMVGSVNRTAFGSDVAVRSKLANFGAAGLADLNYNAIGFMRT
jgi:hypothetical protein